MRGPCPTCDDQYRELCPRCGECPEHCRCVTPTCLLIGQLEGEGLVLLEAKVKGNSKRVMRCAAHCHNSTETLEFCRCLCDGKFHGLKEGSPEFAYAIGRYGPSLIEKWKGIGVDVTGLEKELERLKARNEVGAGLAPPSSDQGKRAGRASRLSRF